MLRSRLVSRSGGRSFLSAITAIATQENHVSRLMSCRTNVNLLNTGSNNWHTEPHYKIHGVIWFRKQSIPSIQSTIYEFAAFCDLTSPSAISSFLSSHNSCEVMVCVIMAATSISNPSLELIVNGTSFLQKNSISYNCSGRQLRIQLSPL